MASVPNVGIEFVDRPDLHWAFVDTSATSVENKAICKLEFCTLRWAPSGPDLQATAKQYPVCRLAMSVTAMVELHRKLTHMLQQLEVEVWSIEPSLRLQRRTSSIEPTAVPPPVAVVTIQQTAIQVPGRTGAAA